MKQLMRTLRRQQALATIGVEVSVFRQLLKASF